MVKKGLFMLYDLSVIVNSSNQPSDKQLLVTKITN